MKDSLVFLLFLIMAIVVFVFGIQVKDGVAIYGGLLFILLAFYAWVKFVLVKLVEKDENKKKDNKQ